MDQSGVDRNTVAEHIKDVLPLAVSDYRTLLLRVLQWVLPCVLFVGCQRLSLAPPTPPPTPLPKVTDLHFPVVVIFSRGYVATFEDAASLGTMYINSVISRDDDPALIDSQFAVYHLAKLRSTHNGLWLMAHPAGVTSVSFELQHAPKSGLEAARTLFRATLDLQTWQLDIEKKRRQLAAQKTLKGMFSVVQSEP